MNASIFQTRLINVLSAINKNLSSIKLAMPGPASEPPDLPVDDYRPEDQEECVPEPEENYVPPSEYSGQPSDIKEAIANLRKIIANRSDIPTEFIKVIEDKFWDLL